MIIRKSTPADLPQILALYDHARKFMADHGNPTQWGTTDPSPERIQQDIREQHSYLCLDGGEIQGCFYFAPGPDENYRVIRGRWLNEEDYCVVHRVASSGRVKGVGSFCLNWAFDQCENLRIDTHRDNLVMQGLLAKLGFAQCGIVTVENGTERIGFQKIKQE